MNIETIHDSLVNGQRRQMVEQVDEYGTYDFWNDYSLYLDNLYEDCKSKYFYFHDSAVSYHHIKNR